MKFRKLVLAMAGTGLAVGMLSAPAVASADTTGSGDVSATAVKRKSAPCASPKEKRINISWGDGSASTTVYYNNHCDQSRAIELEFVRENGTRFNKCFVATAKKKGQKKIEYGSPNKVSILSKSGC